VGGGGHSGPAWGGHPQPCKQRTRPIHPLGSTRWPRHRDTKAALQAGLRRNSSDAAPSTPSTRLVVPTSPASLAAMRASEGSPPGQSSVGAPVLERDRIAVRTESPDTCSGQGQQASHARACDGGLGGCSRYYSQTTRRKGWRASKGCRGHEEGGDNPRGQDARWRRPKLGTVGSLAGATRPQGEAPRLGVATDPTIPRRTWELQWRADCAPKTAPRWQWRRRRPHHQALGGEWQGRPTGTVGHHLQSAHAVSPSTLVSSPVRGHVRPVVGWGDGEDSPIALLPMDTLPAAGPALETPAPLLELVDGRTASRAERMPATRNERRRQTTMTNRAGAGRGQHQEGHGARGWSGVGWSAGRL
jgi:hypothetical protein